MMLESEQAHFCGAEIEQGRENRAKEIEYTMELNKKAYDKYIKQITPVNELGSDMLRAFVTGGIICALGQASVMMMMNYLGMEKEEALTEWKQVMEGGGS